jgi:hypothetical protein
MKLKCVLHDRRIMIFPAFDSNAETVLHREDGSHCETKSVRVGFGGGFNVNKDKTYDPGVETS